MYLGNLRRGSEAHIPVDIHDDGTDHEREIAEESSNPRMLQTMMNQWSYVEDLINCIFLARLLPNMG